MVIPGLWDGYLSSTPAKQSPVFFWSKRSLLISCPLLDGPASERASNRRTRIGRVSFVFSFYRGWAFFLDYSCLHSHPTWHGIDVRGGFHHPAGEGYGTIHSWTQHYYYISHSFTTITLTFSLSFIILRIIRILYFWLLVLFFIVPFSLFGIGSDSIAYMGSRMGRMDG